MPGRRSTPELTSTMSGRTRATAAATVSGVSPPASTIDARRRAATGPRRASARVERDAGAARQRAPPAARPARRPPPSTISGRSAEIVGSGQPRHAPDTQPFGAQPRRVRATDRSREAGRLRARPRGRCAGSRRPIGRRRRRRRGTTPVGRGANVGRRLGGDPSRTTSKNDAQVVRAGGHGGGRVLGTREAADLGAHRLGRYRPRRGTAAQLPEERRPDRRPTRAPCR